MKIAIINQYSSAGGGARFTRALTKALVSNYPNDKFGLFTDAYNLERDSFEPLLQSNKNIEVFSLTRVEGKPQIKDNTQRLIAKKSFIRRIKDFLKKIKVVVIIFNFIKFQVLKVEDKWYRFSFTNDIIKKLEDYDVIYLSWPYFLEPYTFTKPVVGTFHDFNYKHPFGNFAPNLLETVERQMPQWLNISKTAVVSTKFIQSELKKYYPEASEKTKVVYLTSFSITRKSSTNFKKVESKYKLPSEYILSPSNTSKHKNLISLLEAVGLLKQQNRGIKLVLTGFGTERLSFLKPGSKITKDTFVEKVFFDYQKIIDKYNIIVGEDIFPLGYLSDEEVDLVIDNAKLVISASLYEAGSGPAVDAWSLNTPVVFSNIKPFLEQLDFLGTKAWTFDPKDPKDIARVVKEALDNLAKSKQMAKESKEAIDKYTWDDVAEGYYKVFKEAVKK